MSCADLDWRDARQHSLNDVAPDRATTPAATADLRTDASCQVSGIGGTPAVAAAAAACAQQPPAPRAEQPG